MTNEYLDADHPDRYKDMDVMDPPPKDGLHVHCPVCKGHGGWNNRIDAYGEGKHFQSMCSQCWGWGWVAENSKDATCVHDMKEMTKAWCTENNVYHAGMCYHVQKCTKCDKVSAYDSSG